MKGIYVFILASIMIYTMINGIGIVNGSKMGLFPIDYQWIGYGIAFGSFGMFWYVLTLSDEPKLSKKDVNA